MMQTKINETLALGIPGEFVNTNIRRVDSYLAGTDVYLGAVAALKDGKAVAYGTASATGVTGVYVSTHQHIAANCPVDGYQPTLKVAAGNEIAIATMGDVFVDVELPTTTLAVTDATDKADAIAKVKAAAAAITLPKRGDSIYFVTASGAITQSSSSATLLGKVVLATEEAVELSDADVENLVTITVGESSVTVTVKSGAKLTVTTGVRIG